MSYTERTERELRWRADVRRSPIRVKPYRRIGRIGIGNPPPKWMEDTMENQLTKSRDERVFAGVCGGIAKRIGVEPVYVRLAFVASFFMFDGGTSIILYIVLVALLPEEKGIKGKATVPGMSVRSVGTSPAWVTATEAKPARERAAVPVRTSVPVRDSGVDRKAHPQGRDAADDAWWSDEERLEADARRRVEAELGNARSILEKTEPKKRGAKQERPGARRGGFTRAFLGFGLVAGGGLMFAQAVGAFSGGFSVGLMEVLLGAAVAWFVFAMFISSVRRRARRRVGGRS